MLFESQATFEVPALVPETNTEMYFLAWLFFSFSLLLVAPDIFLQALGILVVVDFTAFEQEYH